jgi:Outer membrane protein beta-barrel domain
MPYRGQLSTATLITCVYAIFATGVPYAARGDWNVGAEAHVMHDNNVGNAESYSDIVSDTIVGATLSVFELFPIGEGYSLTVGADLNGEHYNRITGLSNATAGAFVALRKKWGLGAFVPWARVEFSVAHSDYEDDYRNASIYRGTLSAGRRIDERWNLWAEYSFERRSAASQPEEEPGISGDAFSQSSNTLSLNVEYSVYQNTYLNLAAIFRHGDIVSTGEGDYQIQNYARAIAEDPAFGPEDYAYRLTGTTLGFKAGVNYSPTPHSLIGFDFRRFDTRADGGNDYTKSILEITGDYAF